MSQSAESDAAFRGPREWWEEYTADRWWLAPTADASECPCLPGAPEHVCGDGGYAPIPPASTEES